MPHEERGYLFAKQPQCSFGKALVVCVMRNVVAVGIADEDVGAVSFQHAL